MHGHKVCLQHFSTEEVLFESRILFQVEFLLSNILLQNFGQFLFFRLILFLYKVIYILIRLPLKLYAIFLNAEYQCMNVSILFLSSRRLIWYNGCQSMTKIEEISLFLAKKLN